MKHSLASKIVLLLLPLLLLYFVCPKAARGGFFDYAAGQMVTVYSFVMVPLLEVSMLVVEHILIPKTIAGQSKNTDTEGKKQPSSNDTGDYILSTAFLSALMALARKFVLLASGPLSSLLNAINPQTGPALIEISALFALLPFNKPSILHSNPSLARGDPPPAFILS